MQHGLASRMQSKTPSADRAFAEQMPPERPRTTPEAPRAQPARRLLGQQLHCPSAIAAKAIGGGSATATPTSANGCVARPCHPNIRWQWNPDIVSARSSPSPCPLPAGEGTKRCPRPALSRWERGPSVALTLPSPRRERRPSVALTLPSPGGRGNRVSWQVARCLVKMTALPLFNPPCPWEHSP